MRAASVWCQRSGVASGGCLISLLFSQCAKGLMCFQVLLCCAQVPRWQRGPHVAPLPRTSKVHSHASARVPHMSGQLHAVLHDIGVMI